MKEKMISVFGYVKAFLKWTILSAVLGVVGGAIGSVFHLCIDYATETREANPWILFLLPVGGLLITWLYSLTKKKVDTNRVIESIRTDKDIPWYMAPLIFISTVLTHLFGGSAGREGAALQLGGSIGYNFGKLIKLNNSDMHIIVMSGMSAVFAALFGTPVTAMFFALEVTSVGVMYYSGLLPCAISAFAAFGMAQLFGLSPVRFDVLIPEMSIGIGWRATILSALCARRKERVRPSAGRRGGR